MPTCRRARSPRPCCCRCRCLCFCRLWTGEGALRAGGTCDKIHVSLFLFFIHLNLTAKQPRRSHSGNTSGAAAAPLLRTPRRDCSPASLYRNISFNSLPHSGDRSKFNHSNLFLSLPHPLSTSIFLFCIFSMNLPLLHIFTENVQRRLL